MLQEICAPSAGFISCLAWIKLADQDEDSFVFGVSDGNIHLYQHMNEHPVFCFLSITLAHAGAVESLEWDPHHHQLASIGDGEVLVCKASPDQSMYYSFIFSSFFPQSSTLTHVESFVSLPSKAEKQSYVAQSVHFLDDGSSVLVSYLESGYMYILSFNRLCPPPYSQCTVSVTRLILGI